MTPRFILDENIMILAQSGVDDRGGLSPVCSALVEAIIEICHTIVVDDVLWDKYNDQLYRPAYHHSELGPYMMGTLWNALMRPNKIDGLGRISPSFIDESSIPSGSRDDTYIVRLAVETGATLVTTDTPLRDDLESSGIRARYDLEVVTPEEALAALAPSE